MRAWERRLKDLSLLLDACHRSYFEPEQFRLSLNQFLQTSRTINFIIQKNKKDFNNMSWYDSEMALWSNNKILCWARDSRNTIEKEGDLELYSSINVTLITSYLLSTDKTIKLPNENTLFLAINKLIDVIRKEYSYLPKGEWAIKIERVWIANSLPKEELLWCLNYIYNKQYEICKSACKECKCEINLEIPTPLDMDVIQKDSRKIRYFDPMYSTLRQTKNIRIKKDQNYKFDSSLIHPQKDRIYKIHSFEEALEAISINAKEVFLRDKYHIPMLFIFDANMKIIDVLSAYFESKVEKYIFWRQIAERVSILSTYCVFFVSEAWIKDIPTDRRIKKSISELKNKAEILQIIGINNNGNFLNRAYFINRTSENETTLSEASELFNIERDGLPPFIIPLAEAISIKRTNA